MTAPAHPQQEYIITDGQLQQLMAIEISANELIEISNLIRSRPIERKTKSED